MRPAPSCRALPVTNTTFPKGGQSAVCNLVWVYTGSAAEAKIGILDNMLPNYFRYCARNALRNKSFTIIVLLSLAIGIGVNTALFSFVESLLLRPLPVRSPDRLVSITATDRHGRRARRDLGGDEAQDVRFQSGVGVENQDHVRA